MKRKLVLSLVISIVLATIVILIFSSQLNDSINNTFNPIDKSCTTDSDCVKNFETSCSSQCGFECANVNWKLHCPFPGNTAICSAIYAPGQNITCKCLNNVCSAYDYGTNQYSVRA